MKQIEKLDSHKEYGYNEQDTGHKLDEVIEVVNTLTERLEKLETDENRITGTLSTDKTFKIFWKNKHISMELPTQVEPDKPNTEQNDRIEMLADWIINVPNYTRADLEEKIRKLLKKEN